MFMASTFARCFSRLLQSKDAILAEDVMCSHGDARAGTRPDQSQYSHAGQAANHRPHVQLPHLALFIDINYVTKEVS